MWTQLPVKKNKIQGKIYEIILITITGNKKRNNNFSKRQQQAQYGGQ